MVRCTCGESAAEIRFKVEANPVHSELAFSGKHAIRIRQYYGCRMRLNAAAGYQTTPADLSDGEHDAFCDGSVICLPTYGSARIS
jgi:hypothetical protein